MRGTYGKLFFADAPNVALSQIYQLRKTRREEKFVNRLWWNKVFRNAMFQATDIIFNSSIYSSLLLVVTFRPTIRTSLPFVRRYVPYFCRRQIRVIKMRLILALGLLFAARSPRKPNGFSPSIWNRINRIILHYNVTYYCLWRLFWTRDIKACIVMNAEILLRAFFVRAAVYPIPNGTNETRWAGVVINFVISAPSVWIC